MSFAPYRVRPRGLLGRCLVRGVRTLDALGVPASEALSRRSLWGRFPRGGEGAPPGERLLALSFDLDYQADTDALDGLTALAARVRAPMSLAAIGRLVENDPAPYARAAAAGHEIVNHTWSHPDNPVLNPDREFWDLSVNEMSEEIARAQNTFERELGVRPTGFRTPHFKDAPRMLEALARHPEITYVSTALASRAPLPVPYFPLARTDLGAGSLHFSSPHAAENSPLLMIPLTPCPEHHWSPFCSYHAIRAPADRPRGAGMHSLPEFGALWRRMLEGARADGFASVYFDPMDVMRDRETAAAFERMLREARDGGWTLATLGDVERAWRASLAEALR